MVPGSRLPSCLRPISTGNGACLSNDECSALQCPDGAGREQEVKGMAERIISMRNKLYNSLTHELQTPGEWGHIKSQIGMFRYITYILTCLPRMN
jgi:hypothetical protein